MLSGGSRAHRRGPLAGTAPVPSLLGLEEDGRPGGEQREEAGGRHRGGVWAYRELWWELSRKELKVKYKDSVLGFAWSLLNPAMYLVIFYVVFQIMLGSGIPNFAIFLLSGLLVWTLFSASR
jgi:hypothetical protein